MDHLEQSLIESGYSLSRIDRNGLQLADVMTWEGSISSFAGLIGAAIEHHSQRGEQRSSVSAETS